MNINVNLSRRGLIASLAGVALVAPLAGCDNDSASAGGSDAAEQVTLTVGASPSPHAEILNDYAAPLLEEQGIVLVNGEPCTMRGKKLYPGDQVQVDDYLLLVEGQQPGKDR